MSGTSRQPTRQRPSPTGKSAGSNPVMPTYARQDIVFERGEGVWLFTEKGDRYLDFTSGIAVNALGHAHPRLVEAITEQAGKLWHTSNLYRVAGQERLAKRLCAATFADTVFFCNSGTEAVEGAIKVARRYHFNAGASERNRIITFEGAFHGRTLAALSAAGSSKHLEGFAPEMPGFDHVPYGDLDALEAAISPETAAIMIEPIQGEGGVRELSAKDLRRIRKLCDAHEILLVLDEVQSGMGRTGHLFAHQGAAIKPDIMAVAKGLGGGFPVGAVLATQKAAFGMTAGTHGSTFGGNPLAMAAANAVLDIVDDPQFLDRVKMSGLRLRQSLAELQDRFPALIKEVRGQGLLMGLKLNLPPAEAVEAARAQNLLIAGASDDVIRILPPLIVSEDELSDGVSRLSKGLEQLARIKPAKTSQTDRSPSDT